ncbi:MAG TPA: hypothetical protein VMU43_07835 [Candidatus Acidoferrum sp.]|nr:hypothetical protein [Candidatus Acidoferrum sp.]
MPFINGRYYINPIAGETLEAAREAEAALLALEDAARGNSGKGSTAQRSDDDDLSADSSGESAAGAQGPVHRIEIEAAELVPSHTGRAGRGFVARVHRSVLVGPNGANGSAASPLLSSGGSAPSRFGTAPGNAAGSTTLAARPETHVFSNHADLLNFLQDELSRQAVAR